MDNYASNSAKSRAKDSSQIEHRATKIGDVKAKRKKKSNIKKFGDMIISEDVDNVKSYIIMDVIIPSVKKAILDVVSNGIRMILYGTVEDRDRAKPRFSESHTSYRSFYDDNKYESRKSYYRSAYDVDDIIFPTSKKAEDVLNEMNRILGKYHIVRVFDLYECADLTPNPTDANYGWTDISSARIASDYDGFVIRLPRPVPID